MKKNSKNIKANKKIDKRNSKLILIIGYFLIMLIGSYTFVKNTKDFSYLENRSLNKFSHFTLGGFYKGRYQSVLEESMADQFVFGDTIKKLLSKYDNLIDFGKMKEICENEYVSISKTLYTFNCEENLLYLPKDFNEETKVKLNKRISEFNALNKIADTYYYVINSDLNFDFKSNEKVTDFYAILKNKLKSYKRISELSIENFNDFQKKFYITDHHWNYYGSFLAYKDITEMMELKNINLPESKITFKNIDFVGSKSREAQKLSLSEKYTVYNFSTSKHKEYINKLEKEYGEKSKFIDENVVIPNMSGLYGLYYGWDYGEVLYDFNNDNDKDNLLILSNSYSNALNLILASHFNKTYVVDLRVYEKDLGKKFDINSYIKENKIDKVLILGSYNFFINEKFSLKVK